MSRIRIPLFWIIPRLTNVVDDGTAIVLQAGCVAHQTVARHLADDLDVARLRLVLQLPGRHVQQPLRTLRAQAR